MRLVRIGLLFLGISLPVPALSAAEPSLSIPHIDPGGCPGEMCGYYNQELIAQKDTVARAHYGRAAQETYRVRRGERLHAIDGVVITNKPSILKVIKSCELTQGVSGRPGDLVYVLWYEGENFAKAWHRGRYFDIEGDGPKGCTEVVSPDIEAVWWVKVENVAGKIGWVEGDQFHDQGRYASHVPEAEWLVLRRGETKLGYSFTRDGRLLHRDQLLESNLDNSVQKVLVSATPPQFWVVCTRFELEFPPGVDLPKVNESCNLRVEMPENRIALSMYLTCGQGWSVLPVLTTWCSITTHPFVFRIASWLMVVSMSWIYIQASLAVCPSPCLEIRSGSSLILTACRTWITDSS